MTEERMVVGKNTATRKVDEILLMWTNINGPVS